MKVDIEKEADNEWMNEWVFKGTSTHNGHLVP